MKMRKLVAMLTALMMLCCIIPFSSVAADTQIVFEFGANGSAAHVDGTEATSYSETNGSYTLSYSDGSKVYQGACDAQGNSCLKLGTSSVVGSFSFDVPADVTSVIISVAKYKAKNSKLTINGTEYTLSSSSNDGAYEQITVDTASAKTVSLATVSGNTRVMINSITYVIGNGDAPVEPDEPDTPVEPDEPALPDGTELSIADAITLGLSHEHNVFTTEKYYVMGVITEVYNTQYGNMRLTDEEGNVLTIYGSWSADGETRYDALEVKPVAGDTVVLYGIIGQYNGTPQMKNGWIISFVTPDQPDTPVEPDEPDEPGDTADVAVLDLTDKANRVSFSASQQVWKQNGITLTNDKGASTTNVADYANPGRFYKNSTVTLEYPGMTAIVIDSVTYDDNDYAAPWAAIEDANVTATVDDGNVTILFAEPVDSITWSPMTAQGRAYTITIYTDGAAPDQPDEPEIPDDPDQPAGDWVVVTEPDVDTAYKLGLYQTQKDAVYYFIGTMSTYYGATETDVSLAVDMYLENAEDGYYLYFNDANGAKQYIALVQSGTHYNFTFGDEGSVFSWDAELNALYAPCGDEICYMGTYGKYVTVGTLKVSMLSETDYIARLYAEAGATPDLPPCEHEYDDEYDADCNLCGEIREVPDKPIEYAGDIVVSTVEGSVGDTVSVTVTLPNNPGIISAKVKVHFDTAVLKFVSSEPGEFGGNYIFGDPDMVPTNGYVLINWHDGLSADNTSELLATLTFEILEGAAEGLSGLTLEFNCEDDMFNAADETVYFRAVDGGVVVVPASASTPGDVSGDGTVNNRDLALIQQYINKWDVALDLEAADVNDDDVVNNRDLALIQQYINKWDVVLK